MVSFNSENRASAIKSKKKWFPYSKGGEAIKWYGNNDYVVNWEDDGKDIKEYIKFKNPNIARGEPHYFRQAITWSLTSNAKNGFAARFRPAGFVFDINGMSSFPKDPFYVLSSSKFLCFN